MTIAVITANIGSFDQQHEIPTQSVAYDRFYLTECALPFHTSDNRLKAKYYKMLAHEIYSHDILIWMDGNVKIKSQTFIADIVSCMGDSDIVISEHPTRKTVFEEAEYIATEIRSGNKYLASRYTAESIVAEVKDYPPCTGLYWCGLFARRNNQKVNTAFTDWFLDNVKWTNFDQNSFVKMLHVHGLKTSIINWGSFYDNNNYSLSKHTK